MNIKKEALKRAVFGFPTGITIGYIITIIVSLIFGKGQYWEVNPQLIDTAGSEINAVVLQTFLSGLVGSGFSSSSVIWEIDGSIAKQTGIYFFLTSVFMMPIAYFMNWMPHSVKGFIIYFGIFVIIFVVIWIVQYLICKNKIEKMNAKIKSSK